MSRAGQANELRTCAARYSQNARNKAKYIAPVVILRHIGSAL
jgi:hypothetical protein